METTVSGAEPLLHWRGNSQTSNDDNKEIDNYDVEIQKKQTIEANISIAKCLLTDWLDKKWYTKIYIRIMILDWNFRSKETATAVMMACYYIVAVGILLFVSITLMTYIFDALYDRGVVRFSTPAKHLVILFFVNFLIQILSGIVSMYFAARRMNRSCREVELEHAIPAINRCIYFITVFMVLGLAGASMTYSSLSTDAIAMEMFAMVALTLCSCGAVTSNLMFVYIDFKVSTAMLKQLRASARNQSLTITELVAVKSELRNRMMACKIPNVTMGIGGLVSTVTFVLAIYIANATTLPMLTLSVAWYCKEIAYLFMVLYDTARLNAIADKLTFEMGTNIWKQELELQRLQLFANLQAKSISFTFLGTRPTGLSVVYQCGSILLAVLASIVRAVVLNV
jgi:hypothetical protein